GLAVCDLGAALQDLDAMALEQRADAAGQPADDAILPFDGARKLDGRPFDLDAERRLARLGDGLMISVGGVDQRLGGDATDIEAGAAQPAVTSALLDQHDIEAELAGADGRDIAAGPAAHDQNLGCDLGHVTPLRTGLPASRAASSCAG